MHRINRKYYALPGMEKLKNKQEYFLFDLLFFILFAALPSSFFALVPQQIFYRPGLYDLNLFFFASGLMYLLLYFKHLPKIWKEVSGKYFIFLCMYLILQVLYSWQYQDIPIREVITVFRKNFFWPIASLGFLLYLSSMNSYRIERFFRWLLLVTFFMALLYLFSNLTAIDVWGARVKDAVVFEGSLLMQNTYALPRYLHILFVFAIISSLVDYKFKNYWMWIVALLVTILSFVRNQMMVYALYAFITYFMMKISSIPTRTTKTLKQVLLIILGSLILLFIFPKHVDRLMQKFGFYNPNISSVSIKVDNLAMGTLDFRIRLIEESYERTKDKLLFGNGYVREGTAGTYDFVLGSDSAIPSVLYTEGIMGFVMRWIPILLLIVYALKFLFKKHSQFKLYWLAIFTLIMPQFVNIIQTTIFTEYNHWYFIFMSLLILKSKLLKEQKNAIS